MSPMSNWINEAQLIPEGKPYKVDGSGRVIIPAHLRAKFDINLGDDMDYYTTFANNKWFMCITKRVPEETTDKEAAKE